ncbi:hypothetical protein Gasu2_25480 [Galdieria sulphuraria]|nr:hypothetical protein Gasu2_25480 [Galdieria sulphuraria]
MAQQLTKAINNKAQISSTLHRWVTYVKAWKALSEEGKEQLQVIAQRLLYLRAGALESQLDSRVRKNLHEHVSIISQHWEKIKELIAKLELMKQGMHRCFRALETYCLDSSDSVLFGTLSVAQFMKYIEAVNASFSRDFTCKQQVLSSFSNYSSRDILTILITIWWRQPSIDPIEVDFVVGAIVAELAIDEYNILQEDKIFSYLLS